MIDFNKGLYNIFKVRLTRKAPFYNPKKNDIWICSYPRSGNTWMRFLVSNLIYKNEHGPSTFDNIIIRAPKHEDIHKIKKLEEPYGIIKSHQIFTPIPSRIIYLVRDPRDVAISYFYYQVRKGVFKETATDFKIFFKQFITGFPPKSYTWAQHVAYWTNVSSNASKISIVYYEELKKSTFDTLSRICEELEIKAKNEMLNEAISASDLNNMKKLDSSRKINKAKKVENKKIPFVRSGKSNNWSDWITEEMNSQIRNEFEPIMSLMKY